MKSVSASYCQTPAPAPRTRRSTPQASISRVTIETAPFDSPRLRPISAAQKGLPCR
ncbi:MAG: hypothetical protein ACOX6T_27345 [Myxococcales bacterium]